ncbi:MAG: hypothetical protein DWQ01_12355 [Planctomycetota bacterium]|nr:MAG: hypothetical protein DWQ01_12355 [Planctomycetota bacterium]
MNQATEPSLPPLLDPEVGLRHPVAKILAVVAGLFCLVFGLIGWVIPILTGIPFYLLGLALLGWGSRRLRLRINAWETRLPHRARVALRKPREWWRKRRAG